MRTLLVFLFPVCLLSYSLVQARNDANQTGSNTAESLINPYSLGQFGLQCSASVDDFIWSQPLYVEGQTISGVLTDLVIVAANNNTIYAFDASNCTQIWSNHLSSKRPDSGALPAAYGGKGVGCFATPAIDVSAQRIYEICDTASIQFELYELNLHTGALIRSVEITGSVPGTGTGSAGGVLAFSALNALARPGLVLANGEVYVSFGSWDAEPWHGWIMAYDATTLSQTAIFCTTPNGDGGSVWLGGGSPSVDANGDLYVVTGNGSTYNAANQTYTNTVIHLNASLQVLSTWTPANTNALNAADADLAADRFILLGSGAKGLIAAKDFKVYVLDMSCTGDNQGSGGCLLQTLPTDPSGVTGADSGAYGSTVLNNLVIVPTTSGELFNYTWNGSTLSAITSSLTSYGWPGMCQLSGSSNAANNGLLWTVHVTGSTSASFTPQPATLEARDPSTLRVLWSSDTQPRDSLGLISKFSPPTVANGHVIVATQSLKLQIYAVSEQTGSRAVHAAGRSTPSPF